MGDPGTVPARGRKLTTYEVLMPVTVKDILHKTSELNAMLMVLDAHISSGNHTGGEELLERWQERLDEIHDEAQRQLNEIPDFGEAYDLS